ncbi:DUF6220 domain-containing protein [Micromonospora lutea]|uniref:Cytochrome b561 domain-containing protein n=1 Tax=Micromonospora lutea TaxID=419825 RepID=A0ABQ4J2N6_9ACTN|nr:DUF6220 domain-containing protein [Micromonospora lutea]GIJ24443.1 hypothetical protein Vlu01_50670 [Micromonospora lutea]
MKKLFAGLVSLLLLAEVVQFYLAASGAFDSAPTEEAFSPHRFLGYVMLLFSVVLVVVSAIARMPGRITGRMAMVAGLVLIQSLIREVAKSFGEGSETGHLIFGVHAVNGLLIVGTTLWLVRQARQIAWQQTELSHATRS